MRFAHCAAAVMALAALIPVAGYAGYVAGTRPLTVEGPITRASPRPHVEAMFHLGTDDKGRPHYNDTFCGGHSCAWKFAGGRKRDRSRWSIELTLEYRQSSPSAIAIPFRGSE